MDADATGSGTSPALREAGSWRTTRQVRDGEHDPRPTPAQRTGATRCSSRGSRWSAPPASSSTCVVLVMVKRLGPQPEAAIFALRPDRRSTCGGTTSTPPSRSWSPTCGTSSSTGRGPSAAAEHSGWWREYWPFLAVGMLGQAIGLVLLTLLMHHGSPISLPTDPLDDSSGLPHPALLGAADRDRGRHAAVVRAEQAVDLRGRAHPPPRRRPAAPRGREGAREPRGGRDGRRLRRIYLVLPRAQAPAERVERVVVGVADVDRLLPQRPRPGHRELAGVAARARTASSATPSPSLPGSQAATSASSRVEHRRRDDHRPARDDHDDALRGLRAHRVHRLLCRASESCMVLGRARHVVVARVVGPLRAEHVAEALGVRRLADDDDADGLLAAPAPRRPG